MALGAVIYVFDIDLADSDRDVYANFELRVALHPSETEEHLVARVLAYCLETTEGIAFSKGLYDPDEPTIAIRDLTGQMLAWIDVGAPEAARLHRATKSVRRVAVYAYKETAPWFARLSGERIHKAGMVEVHVIERSWLAQLTGRLKRRVKWSLTVSGGHAYLSDGVETLASVIGRMALPDQ